MQNEYLIDSFPFVSQILPPDERVTAQQAEYWSERACGIACVAMILSKIESSFLSLWDLIQEGLRDEAYCPQGWKHHGLLTLLERRGVRGRCVRGLTADDLSERLRQGKVCITSVSTYFRGGEKEHGRLIRPGGHLAMFFGVRHMEFCCHHPSSYIPWNRTDWWVAREQVERSFSGALIEVDWSSRRP